MVPPDRSSSLTWCAVIILGIYLLSKHGEIDDDTASMAGSETHVASRAHFTSGHFGALMPLSPSHRTASMLSSQHSKTFEDKDEHTPLRPDAPPPLSSEQQQQNGGGSNGYHPIGAGTLSPRSNGAAAAKLLTSASPRAYQRIVV